MTPHHDNKHTMHRRAFNHHLAATAWAIALACFFYIGFSQFLLIWYANLPEETIFYIARSNGTWMADL